jgi:hypothetical protein
LMRRLATCINNRIEFPWAARKKKNLNWNEIKMYQTSHYSLACLDNRAGQNCWAEKIWQKKKTDDLDLLGSTAYPTHYVTTRRCRCSGMSLLALKCSNCIRLLEIKVRIYIRVENHSKISDIKHVWFDVKSFHCCSSKEIRTFKVTEMTHLQSQTVETTMINTAAWDSSRKLVSKSESFMCSVYHVFQYRHDLVFHINLW